MPCAREALLTTLAEKMWLRIHLNKKATPVFIVLGELEKIGGTLHLLKREALHAWQ